jgi:hypothetical protein
MTKYVQQGSCPKKRPFVMNYAETRMYAVKRYTKKPRQGFLSSSLDPLKLSAAVAHASVC